MIAERGVSISSTRPARISIDADALSHNLGRVKQLAANSRVMAVIKADAYGHGAERAAACLDAADAFALATVGEALKLRRAGISKPLVVFQGFANLDELRAVAAFDIQPVIIRPDQVDLLEQQSGFELDTWLKIDTGMHRLGVSLSEADSLYQRLVACDSVGQVRLMSHFSNADVVEDANNNKQLESFINVINRVGAEASMANSAAIVSRPDSHLQWVRPGIMLYGSSPLEGRSAEELDLRAVMNFESSLLAVRALHKGDAVGYGGTWHCPEAMKVGVVAAGYADGYPRHAPTGTPVWVNGHLCPLLGRVSMDSISVDLRGVDAAAGDRVVLWGRELPADRVAQSAGTIAYELFCRAGSAVRAAC